ncbi:hypothetical protein Tco_0796677 [Tanacetum coccineum]
MHHVGRQLRVLEAAFGINFGDKGLGVIQSWGRSSYTRAMIEVRANVKLKETIMVVMPKLTADGFYTCNVRVEYECIPPRCACCKVFGNVLDECPNSDVVSRENNVNTNGNKKKDAEPTIEVSDSYPFDVLNSVENDVDLGTNGGSPNLTCRKANTSRFLSGNVASSSTSNTPMVDYVGDHDSKYEVASNDNGMANFLASKKDAYGNNSMLEQWKESYMNGDYDFDLYDDDMYEGQDIPDKIQDICDNFDIIV